MKSFKILLISIITLFSQNFLYAKAPHVLEDYIVEERPYVIDVLAKKQQVKIYVDSPIEKDMSAYYREHFNNILKRFPQRTSAPKDLVNIMEIIKFGASRKAYKVFYDKNQIDSADIKFFFAKPGFEGDLKEICGPGGLGCFFPAKKEIYLPFPKYTRHFDSTALHEIGHSLRLEDLYEDEFPTASGRYGSGFKDSIMGFEKELTCDDADGLINAIYLVIKKFNQAQPDLIFTSFCNKDIKFKNAQIIDRDPVAIHNGNRNFFVYCKSGAVYSLTEIKPFNGRHFYEFNIEHKGKCKVNSPKSYDIKPKWGINYTIKDFNTKKVLKTKLVNDFSAHNTYMQLPHSGGWTLVISEKNQGIPANIAITDEKGEAKYIFAYLDNGYNIVYNLYLNKYEYNNNDGTLFIYERKNPSNYYAYVFNPSKQENNELSKILITYYRRLVQIYGYFPLPDDEGFDKISRSYYIRGARGWENFLLENVPSLKKKELTSEVKALKEELKIKADFSKAENPKSRKFPKI